MVGSRGRRGWPSLWLAALVAVGGLSVAGPAHAADAANAGNAAPKRPHDACGVVVAAVVADPATTQQRIAVAGAPDFIRLRWRLQLGTTLWSSSPALGKAAAAVDVVWVDEPGWRDDLAAWARCGGGLPCVAADQDARVALTPDDPRQRAIYASTLARPPRPGQSTLVALRSTGDGWALAAVRGFDAPEQSAAMIARCAEHSRAAASPKRRAHKERR